MSRKAQLAMLVLAGWLVTAAQGQSPEDTEMLLFSHPSGFKFGDELTENTHLLAEWIPADQTVDHWTERLTVQVYRGLKFTPTAFLQNLGVLYADVCRGATLGAAGEGIINGNSNGYAVSMLVLRCPSTPGTHQPETVIYRVIEGTAALYIVQHHWKANPSELNLSDAILQLGQINVCDKHSSDHPCPSSGSYVPYN